MQYYIDITAEELHKLREALTLLEQLDLEKISQLDLYVYGLTQDAVVIDAAKEALAEYLSDETELTEEDIQLSEIAVAIPVSADNLYYLTGSGITLRDEEFTYQGSGGEGIRQADFSFAHYRPKATIGNFSRLALADSNSWLDRFHKQYGTKAQVQIEKKVKRTEEATQPEAPVEPQAPNPPNPTPPKPKQTSLEGGARLDRDILEDFLG